MTSIVNPIHLAEDTITLPVPYGWIVVGMDANSATIAGALPATRMYPQRRGRIVLGVLHYINSENKPAITWMHTCKFTRWKTDPLGNTKATTGICNTERILGEILNERLT